MMSLLQSPASGTVVVRVQRVLLETNHRSLLPWVEKYVVRDVHAVSAE